MPVCTLVLAFGAELGIIDRHGVKIVKDWDILEVGLQFDLGLGLDALIDRSLEIASRTIEVLTVWSKQGFAVGTEHDSHHGGQLFHPMLI